MQDEVKQYYGQTLQKSEDLQTDACCTEESIPRYVKNALSNVHDEVLMRYYGCGLVAPESLKGLRVLDLGCGSGRDCYVMSQLVGPKGEVVGVDMTPEQLDVAQSHLAWHKEKFGFSNVKFLRGFIESLDELDLAPESFDVVISNCVINLSPDKEKVLKDVFNLLKPGGEMYFSDVYSSRRVEENLKKDPLLFGECLSGALYWNDFLTIAKKSGFIDPRLVKDRVLTIENEAIAEKLSRYTFYSATYRLFKLEQLEQDCEDYGQAVIYKGGIEHHNDVFQLDKHHRIEEGKIFPVCGNTWMMLHDTRFKDYFEFIGNFDMHRGIFEGCGKQIPFIQDTSDETPCC